MSEEQSSAPVIESEGSSEEVESQDLSQDQGGIEGLNAAPLPPSEQKELQKLENKDKLTKKEVKRLTTLRLKVDGEEYDEKLPFELPDDPKAVEYMRQQLQMAKAGHKRFKEYSTLEKQVEQFLTALRENPEQVLMDPSVGVDVKKLAQKVIEQEIENAKKSPEQLEKERLEGELKRLMDERNKEKEAAKSKERELLEQQAFERYDSQLESAFLKSDIPKSPYTVKRVADYMILGIENGIDVSPADVIPLIREELVRDVTDMFGKMPAEVIEGIIGKDKLSSLRKTKVAAKKAEMPPTPFKSSIKEVARQLDNKQPKEDKKQSFKDFFKI